ncbi:MAG TPA: serine/threonine-protein kinase [Pseudonocardiaceae bacterium]|nr:serine/threonine-protein kinase [Pseudonocardiaceae bacterium]
MQEGNQAGPRLVAGRYAVLDELGRGGIGVVWRAQDRVIGRQVALKELRIPPGLGQHEHEVFTQRVLREARTAGALNDPAIVTVYDVVPEGGAMYIVMELIEATTLADIVAHGPLDEQRATAIGRQVLSALETAHAAGIVHRDIKPSNIMVLPGDRVKLTDFGIAQAMDDPSLTATGGIMGSPGYMAPELFHGDPPSPSTDLWSLGATLFHVVEGQAPFQRDTTAATMHAIMYDDPRLHRCSGPLAAVIMGLLVHSPDQRLTAAQVKARLSGTAQPSDVERTDVLPAIAADAERTTMVDRERTTAVTRRPRSTRPWDGDNEANEFTEVVPTASAIDAAAPDAWGDKPRNAKRRTAVIAGVVVVVLALIGGVAFALTRPSPNAVAAPPPSRGSVTGTPSASATATATSAAPASSSSAAPTSTSTAPPTTTTHSTATRVAGGGKSLGGGAPPPPPAPPASPTLSYVQIFRYVWTSGEGHATLSGKQSVPGGYKEEGPLGDLLAPGSQQPNTMPFYLCEVTGDNPYYFSSTSGNCEGLKTIALEGYIYGYPPPGVTSEALYRCRASTPIGSKYDSFDENCEGNGTKDGRLGYVV